MLPTHWEGVIGVENELTGDGRIIEAGALEWETPIPFRVVNSDVGAHDGAEVIGRILEITREANGQLTAKGDFDLGSEVGKEAARQVAEGIKVGVSMDMDNVTFEDRMSREFWDRMEVQREEASKNEVVVEDGEGEAKKETDPDKTPREPSDDGLEEVRDQHGDYLIMGKYAPEDFIMVTTSGRIRSATLVDIPAFKDAKIRAADKEVSEALAASGAPVTPPAEWFANPDLQQPTALVVTDEGQVYGHLATWDTCHTGAPEGKYSCTLAPKSVSDYAYFKMGVIKTDDGAMIPTGVLRFSTRHAGMKMTAEDARSHYDHTGTAGADINVGEDKHGIWVAGALRPDVTEEEIRVLRASPLSGDWRLIKGNLELVGALSVNQPGFPIPRPEGVVASGEITTLVAAGALAPSAALTQKQFSDADAIYLKKLVDRERNFEVNQLMERVKKAGRRTQVSRHAAMRKIAKMSEAKRRGM